MAVGAEKQREQLRRQGPVGQWGSGGLGGLYRAR